MKLPILLTLCLLAGVVNPARPQARRTRTQAEQTRSADRERAKREQAVADSLAHLKALRSLDRLDFALEADRLTLRRGRVVFVSSDTNFVTLSGDMATVQVAPFMGGGPNGIGGITLEGHASNIRVRTEGRDSLPDETEQFNAYRQVLQMMAGKKVIIRTLDIGADKNVDYLGLGKEDNPAMGYRAIRICLEQPEIFKTQLRALLRAAKYGTLAIMYPMIISVEEVLDIQKIVAEVAKELEEEKLPYAIPEQGIMIETPAAVMMSEELAEHVDFFSIGTNDLTQYTLAIDRQNNRLDRFYNPHHEAVLRMIQMTVDGAHKHGKWVGICGELGADTTLTTRFVQMGIDELSVAPSMVLNVRSKICEME